MSPKRTMWAGYVPLSSVQGCMAAQGVDELNLPLQSIDAFETYGDQLQRATTHLIGDGSCSRADFVPDGGWHYEGQGFYKISCTSDAGAKMHVLDAINERMN